MFEGFEVGGILVRKKSEKNYQNNHLIVNNFVNCGNIANTAQGVITALIQSLEHIHIFI